MEAVPTTAPASLPRTARDSCTRTGGRGRGDGGGGARRARRTAREVRPVKRYGRTRRLILKRQGQQDIVIRFRSMDEPAPAAPGCRQDVSPAPPDSSAV